MASPSNILLAPLGALYGAVTRARLALYRTGMLATRRVAAPVISVGNITTGGTGKTPLVGWLARHLAREGERVCILTRGYARADSSQQVVVSDGLRLHAEASKGGDEPRLLAEALLGVAAVISNADRLSAARWAIENLKSNLFILDDGFQHLALARDLDLLTIDSMNPWGGGRLLPVGRLREPLEGLARADAIVLTRANFAPDIDTLRAYTERLSAGHPVFLSKTRTLHVRQLSGDYSKDEKDPVVELPVQPVTAFCALGNPEAFFAHVGADGHTLVQTTSFPDHHAYTQSDVDALNREAQAHGARSLVTTAKDAVKLRGLRFEIPCFVIEIELIVEDEVKLLEMLNHAIRTSRSGQQHRILRNS